MKIRETETEIIGHWIFNGKSMLADEQCQRIDWLRQYYLTKITSDKSGWITLYQDPEDKRYWELNFPKGEMQGGGPPALLFLSENEARRKYNFKDISI
jgi:hypothetical protein